MKRSLLFSFFFFAFLWLFPTTTEAAYSPYQIESHVQQKAFTLKGDRSANYTSGKKLIYDVYQEGDGKQGWRIENHDFGKGQQPYLMFTGWSAIVGYYHHLPANQSTYIAAKNVKTGQIKLYRAMETGLDASKDIEYNKQSSDPETIYNPCGQNEINKDSEECNMFYKSVGFKAYLPLQDLFPRGENVDWQLAIVKNVRGHVVYDYLIVPFHFNDLPYLNGKINLSSGLNANSLVMNSPGVIRRTSPREVDGSDGRYFTQWASYQRVTQDQKGTAVWYGVRSPHDGGATRWTSSPHWTFGGNIVKLSFQIIKKTCPDGSVIPIDQQCTVNVTIHHQDKETGAILRTDKKKLTVGQPYHFAPEEKGVFKDKEGLPFVPTPKGQMFKGTTPNNNLTYTFHYKTSKPNPSEVVEAPNMTKGEVKGKAFWELRRVHDHKASQVFVESNFVPSGKHYAVQNISHKVKLANHFKQQEEPITLLVPAKDVKAQSFEYDFQYEYTNHYRKNYKCVEQQDEDCFKWEYVDDTPVWEKPYKKIFRLAELMKKDQEFIAIKINHKQGEKMKMKSIDEVLQQKWPVGKEDKWNTALEKDKRQTKEYIEQWKKADRNTVKSHYDLKTQTMLPINPGKLLYEIELPSKEHLKDSFKFLKKEGSSGFYFPVDVDDSLKEQYKNQTDYVDYDFAFPLQQSELTNKGVKNEKRLYEWDYASDFFFMTKQTGFIMGYPYAEIVKESFIHEGEALPIESIIEDAEKKIEKIYMDQVGQEYKDDLLLAESPETISGLQRYAIPVSPTSTLKPNEIYANHIVLKNMGLSDATFEFSQTFSFEHYLFGSGADDAWIIEQPDSRVKMDHMKAKDMQTIIIKHGDSPKMVSLIQSRPKEKLHKFRVIDRNFVEKVKKIVGDF